MRTRVDHAKRQPATSNGAAAGGPRDASGGGDQRSRLLDAIVAVVVRDGYPEAKIGDVAKSAGVSRATFYTLFPNKEECLLAAQRALGERLDAEVGAEIPREDSSRAAQSALGALVEFADREPLAFDLLTHEAMLAGPAARDEHDRLMSRLESAVEAAWERASKDAPMLDLSAKMLIEGAIRLLGLRMRRDGDAPRALLGELTAWADSYMVSPRPPRWRELDPDPALMATDAERAGTRALHQSLPKGRHRLGAEVVRSVQRERIIYATAEAIRAKGYKDITVADIVASAGISRDVFYAHFGEKEEAFDATIQLLFEQLLATLGGAFFAETGGWPEQLWAAGAAFALFLEENPSLAHFLFVGTYAPPPNIERVQDFVLAFALFVEGGNGSRSASEKVPRIVAEAIVCAVLEAVDFQIRHDRVEQLRGLIPAITYMVYVPYMGADAAAAFVDAKVASLQDDAPPATVS